MEFSLLNQGFNLIVTILGMITIPGLVLGLVVAIFQTATQIHEISLTFIPKIIMTLIAVFVLASVYGPMLINFTYEVYAQIPLMVGK